MRNLELRQGRLTTAIQCQWLLRTRPRVRPPPLRNAYSTPHPALASHGGPCKSEADAAAHSATGERMPFNDDHEFIHRCKADTRPMGKAYTLLKPRSFWRNWRNRGRYRWREANRVGMLNREGLQLPCQPKPSTLVRHDTYIRGQRDRQQTHTTRYWRYCCCCICNLRFIKRHQSIKLICIGGAPDQKQWNNIITVTNIDFRRLQNYVRDSLRSSATPHAGSNIGKPLNWGRLKCSRTVKCLWWVPMLEQLTRQLHRSAKNFTWIFEDEDWGASA